MILRKQGKIINCASIAAHSGFSSLAYNGEFASTIDFLNDGCIDARPLITGRIKLADIVSKGFEELVNHKEQNIKIIVSPN